ncbi:MAG: Cof-type HAD-IIB family hydrolase [Myxococcales bacterium]|nr:Cof-type HAD-IIB family hydrolase [Myxococcales bacterium]
MSRDYDAIVLDVDGTLLNDDSALPPRTQEALQAAQGAGVVVMVATGRSDKTTAPVVREAGIEAPCVVYNGGGIYDAWQRRMLEQRHVPGRAVERLVAHARERGILPVVSRLEGHYAPTPRTSHQRRALSAYRVRMGLEALPTREIHRITLITAGHSGVGALLVEVRQVLDTPAHLTYFSMKELPYLRDSPLHAVDVQPRCRGKAEAVRFLRERYGIPADRVVAVGDANNDIEMLEAAGLGVAMGNASEDALAAADRQIGDNNSDAVSQLIDELFLAP